MEDVRINFACKSSTPRWFKELTFKVGPQNGVTSGRSQLGGVPLIEQKRQRKLTGLQQQQEENQQRKRET